MTTRPADLPDFTVPPVTEVALGVQFAPLAAFKTVHAGLLWNRFRQEFPIVEEQAPLNVSFETFGSPSAAPELRLELLRRPPIPRFWFMNENRVELIQFQVDRFVRNWRKVGDDITYPRYEAIRARFLS